MADIEASNQTNFENKHIKDEPKERMAAEVGEEPSSTEPVKNEAEDDDKKDAGQNQAATVPPKKFYVIKHVKNKAILEKLKAGKMVVKKIVLPTKPGETAKSLQSPGGTLTKLKPAILKSPSGLKKGLIGDKKPITTPSKKDDGLEKRSRRKPIYYSKDFLNPDTLSDEFSEESDEFPESEEDEELEEEEEEYLAPKRKRGRPKGSATPVAPTTPKTTTPQTGKRRPGRPKKYVEPETDPSPRKRGRPKKDAFVEPQLCFKNSPNGSINNKGFTQIETNITKGCHSAVAKHVQDMEDELPLSKVYKEGQSTSVRQYRPKKLLHNHPVINKLEEFTLKQDKALLLLNSGNVRDLLDGSDDLLEGQNAYLHTDDFHTEEILELLQHPSVEKAIGEKKLQLVTNQVLAQYFLDY